MPYQPVLSIDVFEAVIDQASDHVASLHQLSLVCGAFQPRARYHLFRSITIRSVEQMQDTPKLLDTHLWLPPLVQKVSLYTGPLSGHHWPGHRVKNAPLLDIAPVHILSRLPNLRTWNLDLVGSPVTYGGPWLSFHRSALSCYRRYGGRIRNLELSCIPFDDLSDFTGLVSAFTSIQSVTCSYLSFRTGAELKPFVYKSGQNMLARSLEITHLQVGDLIDFRAVSYLLTSSGATLNNLVLTLNGDAASTSDGFEKLEEAMDRIWLSQLWSLTLIIPYYGHFHGNHNSDKRLSRSILVAIKLLERVKRADLVEVRVEFKLHTGCLGVLGTYLSSRSSATLAACQMLDGALLAFRLGRVSCRSPAGRRRAGRAEFWSTAFQRAFPKLSERGLLVLDAGGNVDTPDPVGHEGHVASMISTSDGKRIATASEDGTIIVWDAEHNTIVQEWLAHQGSSVHALAFSPESSRLVSASDSGDEESERLVVWHIGVDDVRKVAAPTGHTGPVTAIAWSPDGALIASASDDGTLRVWDALTFQQRDLVENHYPLLVRNSRHLQFSPDSRYLAWISLSLTHGVACRVWRPLRGEEPKWLPSHPSVEGKHGGSINALAFDPEGKRIATAHGPTSNPTDPGVVKIWDPTTGAMLAVLTGHSQTVDDVCFSPDGRSILSASQDGSAKIWDAASGVETASLHVHTKYTTSPASAVKACFSPDGKFVATVAESSSTVQLWRTDNASCVVEFIGHNGADVCEVVFSPDGEFLASGDVDGIVVIRPFPRSLRY